MKLLKQSRVILTIYCLFFLGLLGTCLFIIAKVNQSLENAEQIYTHPFAVSNAALEARIAIDSIREELLYSNLSGDPALVDRAIAENALHDKDFTQKIAVVGQYYLGDAQQVDQARQLFAGWKVIRDQINNTAKNGDFAQARQLMIDTGTPAYLKLRDILDAIIDFARVKAATLLERARQLTARAVHIIYLTIFLGFSASFATGVYVVSYVQRLNKESQAKLLEQATHDHLTGLPNRSLFFDRLAQAMSLARREKTLVGVVFIDMDGFKHVNDTLGHEAGDELLVLAAKRLSATVRQSDTVARLGGDEFVVLVTDATTRQAIDLVACKLADALQKPATIKGQDIAVRGSFGVACFPDDGQEVKTLMATADMDMYRSKAHGHTPWLDRCELKPTQDQEESS